MSISTQQLQHFLVEFHSRKLLLHTSAFQTLTPSPTPQNTHSSSHPYSAGRYSSSFDANIVMVLSVLLCALICSLGLNSIIRCSLRFSRFLASDADHHNGRRTSIPRLANTGVQKKALKTFPTVNYSPELKLPGLDTECVICLSEFNHGERVRILPTCNHGFHVRCIDKWLSSHSSCPKCRHCLIETCQKIVGCSQASSSENLPMPERTVTLTPLDPEGLIHGYM